MLADLSGGLGLGLLLLADDGLEQLAPLLPLVRHVVIVPGEVSHQGSTRPDDETIASDSKGTLSKFLYSHQCFQ